jgi:uncharacterized protein YndB with AHSA1/START domain
MSRATLRREVRIDRPPDEVWAVVGDPSTIHTWFPGIVASTVDGSTRVITTETGIPMPEEILTVDPIQRRFQYRVTAPLFNQHLGTIDVIDPGDGTSLVVYSTDADPATLALVIGGAAGNALSELKRQMEGAP